MPDSSAHILEQLSPEHRQLVVRGAEEEEITEVEWVQRAIVLRAGERGVTAEHGAIHGAAERAHRARVERLHAEPILEELTAEHRALAAAGAEAEQITVKEWIERAVVSKAGRRPEHRAAGHGRTAAASAAAGAATYEARRSEHERAEAASRREPERHEGREGARSDRGFSAYHSHIAARAAAAEEMPLDIWMEQAILDRAGYRGREGGRAHAEPPPGLPPPPPAPARRIAPAATSGGSTAGETPIRGRTTNPTTSCRRRMRGRA